MKKNVGKSGEMWGEIGIFGAKFIIYKNACDF